MADLSKLHRGRRSKDSCGYLGVRRRPCGQYAAEIRNPFTKEQHWLGTFDTVDEAAFAHDMVSISFSDIGRARTNFYYPFWTPPLPPPTSSMGESDQCSDDDESMTIAAILQSFRQNHAQYPL